MSIGLFDHDLSVAGWFDEQLPIEGWFDDSFLGPAVDPAELTDGVERFDFVGGPNPTISGISFGTPASDRIVVVFFQCAATPSAVAIGGVSATFVANLSGSDYYGIAWAAVPSSSSGSLVLTGGGAYGLFSGAFAVYGEGLPALDFAFVSGATSSDIDLAGGGVVVGAAITTGAISWTGVTEQAEYVGLTGSNTSLALNYDTTYGAPATIQTSPAAITRLLSFGVIHATTGALTGPGATVAGAAARSRAMGSSGVLVGPGADAAGAATRFRTHAASGVLVGSGSGISGVSARISIHGTSGTLAGNGSLLGGVAARTRQHPTSGALTGTGSVVAGSAARIGAPSAHATDGILVGPGASVSGLAARSRAFSATGALTGQASQVAGAASRTRLHDASGVMAGFGAAITGSADRSAGTVTHAASGQLIGNSAVLDGSVERSGSTPPSVGDYTHLRRRRRA